MTREEDEMAEGYRDGRDLSAPEPSSNRSHSYRHGFAVRRAEVLSNGKASLAPAHELRRAAETALFKDREA